MPMNTQKLSNKEEAVALTSVKLDKKDSGHLISSFCYTLKDDDVETNRAVYKMKPSESLIDTLKKLEKDENKRLVSDLAGDSCWCCARTILEGKIGCGTKHGETHFLPPGSYWYKGIGVNLVKVLDVEQKAEAANKHQKERVGNKNDAGTSFRYKDVTYINLAENNMAVVQVNSRQIILGSGRYVLRAPSQLFGRVNVQCLKEEKYVTAITEGEAKRGQVEQVTKRILAGRVETANAVTFVRAQPGFHWMLHKLGGGFKCGKGFTIGRDGTKFLEFVDMHHYGRTTRQFALLSKDRNEVLVRVQLRWRIHDAVKWIMTKGASADIFDAIEETAQALLRDAIAGQSYDECVRQSTMGYDGIEESVVGRLKQATESLGGALLGFEIRELTFPRKAKTNMQRADKENRDNEKVHEAKYRLSIENEDRKRTKAKQEWDMKIDQMKLTHRAKMQVLQDKLSLQKMQENATLSQARQEYQDVKQALLLKGREKHQITIILKKEAAAVAEAKCRMIQKKGLSDVKLQEARAESESIKARADADAQAKEKLAEAEAKAAELVGAAYKNNPAFLKLEMEKINTAVMTKRADALQDAVIANPASLMPIELQRELAFINSNMSPIRPIILPGGGGVVQMHDQAQIQHGL